jgi:hypothetical protein
MEQARVFGRVNRNGTFVAPEPYWNVDPSWGGRHHPRFRSIHSILATNVGRRHAVSVSSWPFCHQATTKSRERNQNIRIHCWPHSPCRSPQPPNPVLNCMLLPKQRSTILRGNGARLESELYHRNLHDGVVRAWFTGPCRSARAATTALRLLVSIGAVSVVDGWYRHIFSKPKMSIFPIDQY